MKTTSEDKSIDGGKTRMGIIYQNVIFWWKINHPPFPKFWPFWSNYNLGVVWDAFSMNSKTWRYRISDITYQILGLRIFELDVLLFSPLRFVFQNSLKKFKLGRKFCLLIQAGLDLVFIYLFEMSYLWKIEQIP